MRNDLQPVLQTGEIQALGLDVLRCECPGNVMTKSEATARNFKSHDLQNSNGCQWIPMDSNCQILSREVTCPTPGRVPKANAPCALVVSSVVDRRGIRGENRTPCSHLVLTSKS